MSGKTVAKNTLFLYIRMVLIMGVSLYSSRVVLEVLGVEDYGIYNVVGGIVTFFTFLRGTMASATQRFFSFALGESNFLKLKKIFTVNLLIYIAIAIVALVLLETLGLWFVNEKLNVPPERLETVRWIFHFSVLTFVASIFVTPFMAIIIAHEDMQIYAYVSVLEAIMKLGVLYFLINLPWDKLEIYGVLIFIVSVINAIIYIVICTRKYSECQFKEFYWDKGLFHEIVGFTGWSLFGQITSVSRNQAITILLNQTFNPIVVAARAIAMSVTTQINVFSNNFNTGLYPAIIKSYAEADNKKMFSLIFLGSKITFFLMWVFALPMFIEMDTIMHIWLKNPPMEAVLFTRLALVEVLINSISLPIATAARAPGKMKVYELTLGSIQIAIFLVSWLVLTMGSPAYSVFVVAIVANLVMFIVRLLIVRALIGLPLGAFFHDVVIPILGVVLFSVGPSLAIYWFLPKDLIFTIVSVLSSVLFAITCMYFIGINKSEREKIWIIIRSKISKISFTSR